MPTTNLNHASFARTALLLMTFIASAALAAFAAPAPASAFVICSQYMNGARSTEQCWPSQNDCASNLLSSGGSIFQDARCECRPAQGTECGMSATPQATGTMSNPGGDRTTMPNINNPAFSPLGATTLPGIMGRVIRGIMGLAGVVALIMFIYGGFLWMTAAGDSKQVSTAKNIFIWAAIGLLAIFSSYAIVATVIGALS